MNEIVACPQCSRKLQVPENFLGQQVQCPTCGTTFVANAEGPAPQAPGGYPPPPPPPSYRPSDAPPPRPYEPDRRREQRYDDDDYGDRARGYDRDDDRDYDLRRRRRRDAAPHRGSTVLTMGILGLVLCGPIFGPIAWVMGHSDLQEMRAGRMDTEGEGMTNAGKICGMIGTILSIIGLTLWFLIFLMAAADRRW